jgi:UDPglucose 6-dehydrogenase/GDP-mannose 6-dehydrogenase
VTDISVLGVGYVGIVTGALFADKGHDVTCIDVEKAKVDQINRGESPIYEPGLDEIIQRNVGKRLRATLDAKQAILSSSITFIAVGTPFDGTRINLKYIEESARVIGEALRDKKDYHVVVVKSTVVPGTTDQVVKPILEKASGKRCGVDFGLGMNPEFLTEGEAVGDFMFPDRIVVGGNDQRAQDVQLSVYEPFPGERVRCNNSTAELIKYSSNALLALLISVSNELANLATALGDVDAVEVMSGLHSSRYLTTVLENGEKVIPPINSFLLGGCGFGGSCLPKDVSALVAHGRARGVPMNLLQAVLDINLHQHERMFELLAKHLPSLAGKKITVLGLSFRPDTNDMRESPSIPIVKKLLAEGAVVTGYDPAAAHEAKKILGDGIRIVESLPEALQGAEAVLLVTRWKEFNKVPELLKASGSRAVLIDGRRMLPKDSVDKYEGIGLGNANRS